MIGAIAGDIIGSVYERAPLKSTDFPLFTESSRFTDDTVLTVATAYTILNSSDYTEAYRAFGRMYPDAGYGGTFFNWLFSDTGDYQSWGNGSAMRISPVGFAFNSVDKLLNEAEKSASVTHSHPEGIKGAQATALAIYLARSGKEKQVIKKEITERFGYDLERTLESIRPGYRFDVSCQGSVPESMIAFLESTDYESAVRNAVSLGGDSDTMACIAGGIAQAFYKKVPEKIIVETKKRLPAEFLRIIAHFNERFGLK